MQARSKAAAEQQEQLRQLATDDALKAANQQLQEQVEQLQEQLDAATALQRSTQVWCDRCYYCACHRDGVWFRAVQRLWVRGLHAAI